MCGAGARNVPAGDCQTSTDNTARCLDELAVDVSEQHPAKRGLEAPAAAAGNSRAVAWSLAGTRSSTCRNGLVVCNRPHLRLRATEHLINRCDDTPPLNPIIPRFQTSLRPWSTGCLARRCVSCASGSSRSGLHWQPVPESRPVCRGTFNVMYAFFALRNLWRSERVRCLESSLGRGDRWLT